MLTLAQKQTLKAYILADPELNSKPNNADGNTDIANLMAMNNVPDYWVWRTSVARQEIYDDVSPDGTTWNWDTFKAQSVTEQGTWREMFSEDMVNFSKPNFRAGVATIFTGNAAQLAQKGHCLAVGRRKANRAEKLYSVASPDGTGNRGSTTKPDTMTVQGTLSVDDIQEARNLP